MKIKENKVIQVEKFICEICATVLLQNGDGTFLSEKGNPEYKYTVHTICLMDFLDKLLKK